MRLTYITLISGWAVYITSFFLPAASIAGKQMVGYAAAWLSLIILSIPILPLLFRIFIFYFTLCNILMLLSPFILFHTKMKKHLRWYRISMSAATLFTSLPVIFDGPSGSPIGSSFWSLSFLFVTISLFMIKPQNVVEQNEVD